MTHESTLHRLAWTTLAAAIPLAGCGALLGVDFSEGSDLPDGARRPGDLEGTPSADGAAADRDGAAVSGEGAGCDEEAARACAGKCGTLRTSACQQTVRCGDCSAGETCGAAGPNVCGRGACTARCEGKACGDSDGCGDVCNVGSCPAGTACELGACVEPGPTKIVLHGGQTTRTTSETWVWDGDTWSRLENVTNPVRRSYGAIAALGGKVVLFGGSGGPLPLQRDTWEWDGANWSELRPPVSPPARRFTSMAPLGGKLVLFGGVGDSSRGRLDDTWEWDGTNWSQRQTSTAPSARQAAAMAALGRSVILFGGTQQSGSDAAGEQTNDTWSWDGERWSKLNPPLAPSRRERAAMARYGDVLVLFGGLSGLVALQDTWIWDGRTWTRAAPSVSPSPRWGAAMAPLGKKLLLFGGYGTSALGDTWEWDGTVWTERTPPESPPPQSGVMFAPAR
jgi:N-acetylneuraminic acid mutarotase